MTATPALVSIVLPTLNGSRFIATSIESCLAQSYEHFELIIVDGGSTDGTLVIVRSFGDPRIRLINQPGNVDRLPGALNCGFAAASGSPWNLIPASVLSTADSGLSMPRAKCYGPRMWASPPSFSGAIRLAIASYIAAKSPTKLASMTGPS